MREKERLMLIAKVSIVAAVGVVALVYSPSVFGRLAGPIVSHHMSGNPVVLLFRILAAFVIVSGGPIALWWGGAWIGLRVVLRISKRFVGYEVAR